MSTKIYNAYKYSGNIFELMEDIHRIHDDYRAAVAEQVKYIIPIFMRLNPECAKDDPNNPGNNIPDRVKIVKVIREQCKKEYPEHSDVFCFRGSVAVYPIENILLVHFFGLDDFAYDNKLTNPTFEKLVESGKLTDYHYQDQADPWYEYARDDNRLTPKEYKKAKKDYKERKRLWDIVFDKHWAPIKAGLVTDFRLNEFEIMQLI